MKKNYFYISIAFFIITGLTSCKKALDREPINTATATQVYSNVNSIKQALAKVYAAYGLTGSSGSGSSDLGGIDAGTSDFLRLYWQAQELPTEEAINAWNDAGLPDYHNMSWSASNTFNNGLYNRCIYQITVANDFIRNTTDAKLSSNGITGTDATTVRYYRAEARFIRAYQYWVLMDLYGNPPFIDENSPIATTYYPPQITRAKLFAYIESELLAVQDELVAPKANEYGRADQAAAWALLARMYLNANIYLGTSDAASYTNAITYASKVINSGYSLMASYKKLFMGDNNLSNTETILSVNYDGVNSQNYGGTTYLINAAVSSASTGMIPANYGIPNGGWGGNRSTSALPNFFTDYSGKTDTRAMFFGSTPDINAVTDYTQGLAVVKFTNLNSDGTTPTSSNGVFTSTDFPLFRLGEMYLVYAEAVLRGGSGGSTATALNYVNLLRTRAYGNTNGNFTSLTLSNILNERGRELYWEGFRRTDLIRYGLFTSGSYLWPWKGGLKDGQGTSDYRTLYPIPTSDITNNPNLIQNTGY